MKASGRNLRRTLLLISLSAFVAACGGGGGSSSNSPSPMPNPSQPQLPGSGGSGGNKGGGGSIEPGPLSAVLTWDAPTTNVDGTCLSDLQAYQVNYGLSHGVYTDSETVEASAMSCTPSGEVDRSCGAIETCTYMVENLGKGTYHFVVQAVDAAGNVSENSNEVIRVVQ